MTDSSPEAHATSATWEELSAGAEVSATVLMASGFVLPDGQRVRERYRVERVLGKGAMGRVLAVSLAGAAEGSLYALKVVARAAVAGRGDPDAGDETELFARLLRKEAAKQDVVQRHGVNVARLFALVQLDDGTVGLRMELAKGRPLEDLLDEEHHAARDRAPDVRFALTVARKLLGQLRRLHEIVEPGSPLGFIHSDVKPGNVFVDAHDRADPVVTLLDFGVATAGQALARDRAALGGRTTFTLEQSGGTIGYAPPHHFTGRPTPLSDVFAAVVILYETITLEWPWDAGGLTKTPVNLFKIEALMTHPPRAVRAVRPSVPAGEAALLDAFFAREFAALVALADRVAVALADPEGPALVDAVPELTTVAQEYQARVDALATELSNGSLPPTRASAAAVAAARATASSAEGASVMLSYDEAAGDDARALAPTTQSRPDARESGRSEKRGGSGRWLALGVLLLAAGAGAWVYAFERPWAEGQWARIVGGVGGERGAAGAGPGAADAAVRVERADAAVAARVERDAAGASVASAVDAGGVHACRCVADAVGVRVRARGGSLAAPVVLCVTTRVATGAGAGEFVGEGTVPRGVREAFPVLECEGGDAGAWGLRVEQVGAGTVFRCAREAVAVVAVDGGAGDAASARAAMDAGGAEGSDAGAAGGSSAGGANAEAADGGVSADAGAEGTTTATQTQTAGAVRRGPAVNQSRTPARNTRRAPARGRGPTRRAPPVHRRGTGRGHGR